MDDRGAMLNFSVETDQSACSIPLCALADCSQGLLREHPSERLTVCINQWREIFNELAHKWILDDRSHGSDPYRNRNFATALDVHILDHCDGLAQTYQEFIPSHLIPPQQLSQRP